MAARSWEQFDADLASGKSQRDRNYDLLISHDVNGDIPRIQAGRNAGVKVALCPPAIAKGAVFMGGKPDLRRAKRRTV
jgi:hypothetical protein